MDQRMITNHGKVMAHLKPRRGPRQMPLATKLHGSRGKRNPDDTQEQLDELDDSVWTFDTCPYMIEIESDYSKCYCSARAREHCKREI